MVHRAAKRSIRLVLVRRVFTSTISNRAVKPRTADGTAFTGGRVGRCHLLTQVRAKSVVGRRTGDALFMTQNPKMPALMLVKMN